MSFFVGTPHTHNAGYYYNDDRASGGRKDEADVQSCPHCEGVILMQSWKNEGGWCAKCNAPLCSNPVCMAETAKLGCVPFIRKLEAHIDMSVKLERFIKLSGLEPPVSHQPIYTGQP